MSKNQPDATRLFFIFATPALTKSAAPTTVLAGKIPEPVYALLTK